MMTHQNLGNLGKCWKFLPAAEIELTSSSCFLLSRIREGKFVSTVNTEFVTLQLCRKVVLNFFLVPKAWRRRVRFHGEYKDVTLQFCRKEVFNFFLVPRDWRERVRFHGEYRTCVITNLKKSRVPGGSQFLLMEYSFRVPSPFCCW